MARDFKSNRKDERAVNWADVAMMVAALEKEYGGLVKVQIDQEGSRGAAGALWVRVLAYEGWSDFGERPKDVVTSLWPSNRYRTMAGCIFNLLHSMDHCLEARRRAADEDVPF